MQVKSTNIFKCMSFNLPIKLTDLNLFILIPVSYKNVYFEPCSEPAQTFCIYSL